MGQLLGKGEVSQGCLFGTILGAKLTFLLHRNFNLALKLIQTGNPEVKRGLSILILSFKGICDALTMVKEGR